MDSFFASIEMRERPQLEQKPVAVGGGSSRGVVCTCNYVARKFGVRSAMPGFMAKKKCPALIFLPVRGTLYREESRKIRSLVKKFVSPIEVASVDEMYFKINEKASKVREICEEIRQEIFAQSQLTASVGIAPSKMLAKIASDQNKPNGVFLLREEEQARFMSSLSLRKIPGIGPKAFAKLESRSLHSCGDLQKLSRDELLSIFGSWGLELYERCRGVDHRKLSFGREPKSFSLERTLGKNIESEEELVAKLKRVYVEFKKRFEASQKKSPFPHPVEKCFARLKFSNFQKATREKICPEPQQEDFIDLALNAFHNSQDSVRLVGIGVRFKAPRTPSRNPRQLRLFA